MHRPPAQDDPLIGVHIGSYVVRRKLGEGGMGVVYELYHPGIDRRMALKVLHPELSRRRDIVQRFFAEARAANVIHHPNIIDITDLNQLPSGGYYIQMEFLEGEALADLLERQPILAPVDVAHICIPICDALHAAHTAGIIHRDLKPDNVQLVPQPGNPRFVKILDFGIAKLAAHLKRGAPNTISNIILGTPDYMAPEQALARNRIVDQRADIYALGVMMYRMLSGRLPFGSPNITELVSMHLNHHQVARLAGLRPDLPPIWSEIVHRCMALDMNHRYRDMTEVRYMLAQAAPGYHLRAATGTAHPRVPAAAQADAQAMGGRRRRWFLPVALTAIGTATAAIIVGIVATSPGSNSGAGKDTAAGVSSPPDAQKTVDAGAAPPYATSVDATSVDATSGDATSGDATR